MRSEQGGLTACKIDTARFQACVKHKKSDLSAARESKTTSPRSS
jgi:hypothetical protein